MTIKELLRVQQRPQDIFRAGPPLPARVEGLEHDLLFLPCWKPRQCTQVKLIDDFRRRPSRLGQAACNSPPRSYLVGYFARVHQVQRLGDARRIASFALANAGPHRPAEDAEEVRGELIVPKLNGAVT